MGVCGKIQFRQKNYVFALKLRNCLVFTFLHCSNFWKMYKYPHTQSYLSSNLGNTLSAPLNQFSMQTTDREIRSRAKLDFVFCIHEIREKSFEPNLLSFCGTQNLKLGIQINTIHFWSEMWVCLQLLGLKVTCGPLWCVAGVWQQRRCCSDKKI
jgi:hypothetical protein